MSRKGIAALRERLNHALRKERLDGAFELYGQLEELEPDEARWPHRKGDLLARLDRIDEAVASFEHAIDLYASQGFLTRAIALAKVILGFDPSRDDVLQRLDPEAARELHRRHRTVALTPSLPDLRDGRISKLSPAPYPALKAAADEGVDEIRFEDGPSIELDITDLEIVDRMSFPEITVEAVETDDLGLAREAPAATPTADQLAMLPAFPVFAELPREAFPKLATKAELVELSDGEIVLRNGDLADSLYAIVEGRVRVHVPGIPEEDAVVLAEGDVFGESCLVEGATRKADVFADGKLTALRITEADLDELIAAHPQVGDVMFDLLTRRVVGNLMFTSPLFAGFDTTTRAEIAKLFEARKAEEDQKIIEAGKRSDGLYVLLAGTLELSEGESGELLEPVTMIGQASLLSHGPATHTVRTISEALVLRLPASRFLMLAATYPTVLEQLSELADQPAAVQLA